jgi:hypothetical protein
MKFKTIIDEVLLADAGKENKFRCTNKMIYMKMKLNNLIRLIGKEGRGS